MELARVLVAMSGGVDSALTAALLIEEGHQVEGVTLELFENQSPTIIEDAKSVCLQLGIAHRILDVIKAFKDEVMDPFAKAYQRGETPNPCILCNPSIKFGRLFDYMVQEGFDYLATGHYAKIRLENGRWELLRSCADRKDQAYFLNKLKPSQLSKLLCPLGKYSSKELIREEALKRNLPVAQKKDSDGICFVVGMDYRKWLERYLNVSEKEKHLKIVDTEGVLLGLTDYRFGVTIGQKRGLGIELQKDQCVVAIDTLQSTVIIGPESQVYSTGMVITNLEWINEDPLTTGLTVKERALAVSLKLFNWGYLLSGTLCSLSEKEWLVTFDQPVRAIAPGQQAVFYDGDIVLGGGRIDRAVTL